MSSRGRIARRTFLRGVGGAALALPALEIMGDGARGASSKIPSRYVFVYGGLSTGTYSSGGKHADMLVPKSTGSGYDITYALEPLKKESVASEVTIVSGLKLPWIQNGKVPPAGRSAHFHYNTVVPQIAGTRTTTRGEQPKGPTSDQLVAAKIAGSTRHKSLSLRVQPDNYVGNGGSGGKAGRLTWKRDSRGKLVGVDPIVDPQLAYQSLFSSFVPTDPSKAAAAKLARRERQSVVDLVRQSYERLVKRLGRADRLRMTRHLDEVRALEKRLAAISPSTQGACRKPTAPAKSWPIGSSTKLVDSIDWNKAGYSDESKRAEVLGEMIRMALACDQTRVVAYQLTMWKCYMGMFKINGVKSDLHECSHGAGGGLKSLSDGVAWHVAQFAKLVSKLASTKEVDGTTLLDHTALVMTFEGGHGYDPEGDKSASAHSTENMVCLLAGGAGKLRRGEHIIAKDAHPGRVVLTAMHAAGARVDLGDLSKPIDALTKA